MIEATAMIDPPGTAIPVLIVTFRNQMDAVGCLAALGRMDRSVPYAVFICENGGAAAYDALLAALVGADGGCMSDPIRTGDGTATIPAPRFERMARLRLLGSDDAPIATVHVGQASENLGYAGGVNAYLEPLSADPTWPGAWILNPDTEPAPSALHELVDYAVARGRGMVGSRIVTQTASGSTQMSGLAWRRWRCATAAVGASARSDEEPSPEALDAIEGQLDAASGASLYVTRACLAQIGLMDERFFLYCEDLEWGLRAKRHGPIGYAHRSVIVHEQGTTTGSAWARHDQSKLTTYLDCRNRLALVRRHRPLWLPLMVFIELLEIADAVRHGAFGTGRFAARGLLAGLLGETGRPAAVLGAHTGDTAAARRSRRPFGKDHVKVAITALAWPVLRLLRAIDGASGGRSNATMTVLYYHGISAENEAGFARQMRQLARWARVVPAGWDGAGPGDRRPAVAITFDDAFDSVLDRALPILASHEFPCTIFVPTAHLGHKPSWTMDRVVDGDESVADSDRIACLSPRLVTIGSHSENHLHLTALSTHDALSELSRSMDHLATLTGRDIRLFAFPYGDFDVSTIEACRVVGYERVFTIEPVRVDTARDSFVRGRIGVEPYDGRLEFFLKATGCYQWMATVSAAKRRFRALRGLPSRS